MFEVSQKSCAPCQSATIPSDEQIDRLLSGLDGWSINQRRRLTKAFAFPDFRKALAFVNRVGLIADDHGHHPEIHFSWHRVQVLSWTHDVGGLTDRDFALAKAIDNTQRDGLQRPRPLRPGGS